MRRKFYIFIFLFLFVVACAEPNFQITSKEVQARMDLARSFLIEGKPRASLVYLLPIKEQSRKNPYYHLLLGLVYFQMKKFSLAKKEFEIAVDIKSSFGEAWNNLGLTYIQLKDIKGAKRSFKRAMEIPTYLTPEVPAYNLARIYYNQKDYENAKKYLKRSLDFNWRYIPSYLLLSKIFEEEDDLDSSVKYLEKAMEADPQDVQVLLKLAEGYLKKGEKEKSILLFKKIVKEFPLSDASKVARDYLVILQ